MAEYIDREALIAELTADNPSNHIPKYMQEHCQMMVKILRKYPAADVVVPPCNVGSTVYKICPKCNEHHNGSCERCAWRDCFMTGCDVGVRVWYDGSHNEHPKQIVPRKVTKYSIITIFELWNIMYFATEEEANTAKAEYDAICNIQDRNERYEAYTAWEAKRKMHYGFLEGAEGR